MLCCDTCTLVFHLNCVRPKLTAVPKGQWRCAHCIIEDSDEEEDSAKKQEARAAVTAMLNLSKGLESDDEGDAKFNEEDIPTCRSENIGEITIAHSGRKFILRKTAKKQISELGRYNSLGEALENLPAVQQMKSLLRSKRARASDEVDNQLFCTNCVDDPSIEICCFCGCKTCYGKFDSHLLILCDHCDRETHTYCLHPPLNAVPSEEPWYCETCRSLEHIQREGIDCPALPCPAVSLYVTSIATVSL